ncbi:hypothetical protein FACS1894176_05430 [Bacteroidia bacterium]|nr:hypothetical protein FACS1894176_05430 [Bacteroidia bacterium]
MIALLKGIVYSHDKYWNDLLDNEVDVSNYFDDINLAVVIDKSEGFAYLKQKPTDKENEDSLKLIDKRQLNFHVSLLCLLLRKHLIESDSEGDVSRAILSKDEIINLMKPFYNETTNEANQIKKIGEAIGRVEKEGFLRRMKTEEEQYEINRIIKAFVNADVVSSESLYHPTYTFITSSTLTKLTSKEREIQPLK